MFSIQGHLLGVWIGVQSIKATEVVRWLHVRSYVSNRVLRSWI